MVLQWDKQGYHIAVPAAALEDGANILAIRDAPRACNAAGAPQQMAWDMASARPTDCLTDLTDHESIWYTRWRGYT